MLFVNEVITYVTSIHESLVQEHDIISCILGRASATKRAGHVIRPPSPKSPVASASAFESIEGSDEEDNMPDNSKMDASYLHANGNAVSSLKRIQFYFLSHCFILSKP